MADCEMACALSEACHAVNIKFDVSEKDSNFCYLLGSNLAASRTAYVLAKITTLPHFV